MGCGASAATSVDDHKSTKHKRSKREQKHELRDLTGDLTVCSQSHRNFVHESLQNLTNDCKAIVLDAHLAEKEALRNLPILLNALYLITGHSPFRTDVVSPLANEKWNKSTTAVPEASEEEILQLVDASGNPTALYEEATTAPLSGFAETTKVMAKGTQNWLSLRPLPVEKQKELVAEIQRVQQLQHASLCKFVKLFHYKEKLWLFQECPGDQLSQWINAKTKWTEAELAHICLELLQGLALLHSSGIAHKAIRPDNIFLGTDGHIKIGFLQWGDDAHGESVSSKYYYLAPECVEQLHADTIENDIWSFGCTLLALVLQKTPREKYTPLRAMLSNTRKGLQKLIPPTVSSGCASFLCRCLTPNPQSRVSASDLLNDPWLKHADAVAVHKRVSDTMMKEMLGPSLSQFGGNSAAEQNKRKSHHKHSSKEKGHTISLVETHT